jgi:hypothetical protein
MLVAIELLIQLTPSSLWAEALHHSGLFAHCMATFIADKVRDAARVRSPVIRLRGFQKSATLLCKHIQVFARMAISDASVLLQLISLSAQTPEKAQKSIADVLECWWQHVRLRSQLVSLLEVDQGQFSSIIYLNRVIGSSRRWESLLSPLLDTHRC